jgi:hypothetical protein
MWMRLCALAMGLGLACVLGGVGLALGVQGERLACDGDPCGPTEARQRLAIEASLLGVILSALATAALAGGLMRLARPRVRATAGGEARAGTVRAPEALAPLSLRR